MRQSQIDFCNNLKLDIQNVGASPGPYGWGIVTFCVYSSASEEEKAILKFKLKNGYETTQDIRLTGNSCTIQQASLVGMPPSMFGWDEIDYIEVTSKTCPNVRDIETDMSKLKVL